MARKKYDLVVTVGEYQGRDGQTKREYRNIGAVLENDKGLYMIIDRTFNPAGVPNPENRGNLIVSMFEPRNDDQRGNRQQSSQSGQQYDRDMPDDRDIPF